MSVSHKDRPRNTITVVGVCDCHPWVWSPLWLYCLTSLATIRCDRDWYEIDDIVILVYKHFEELNYTQLNTYIDLTIIFFDILKFQGSSNGGLGKHPFLEYVIVTSLLFYTSI